MDRALQPVSGQGDWARLSEERTRDRTPGMSSTMSFWGAKEQAELSLEKKDLCCLFLNPGVKCLKIYNHLRKGLQEYGSWRGKKKILTGPKLRLLGGAPSQKHTRGQKGHGPFGTDSGFWPRRTGRASSPGRTVPVHTRSRVQPTRLAPSPSPSPRPAGFALPEPPGAAATYPADTGTGSG